MKSERERVRDEIYDHLMCKYETNIACGMEEEKAVEAAIKDLGDAEKLKSDLGAVHGYAPKTAMKKALEMVMLCCIWSVYEIFKEGPAGDIFTLLIKILFLTGFFSLSKANKKLKNVFNIYAAIFVLTSLINALSPTWFSVFNFNIPYGIIIFVLEVLCWINLVGGLHELVKPYEGITPIKNSLIIIFAVNMIVSVIRLVLFVGYFKDNNYHNFDAVDKSDWEFLFLPLIIFVLLMFYAFRKVSNLLLESDHEYKTETAISKKFIVFFAALVIGLVPRLCVDVCYSFQKAETSPHTIDDTNISITEYDRICGNLLSYGIPEEIVYNLPESEIEMYSDSLNLSELDDDAQKYYKGRKSFRHNIDGVIVETDSWAITLMNNDVRILSCVKYIEGSKGYIDGVFLRSPLFRTESNDKSDFLLILSEENKATVINKPIQTHYSRDIPYYGYGTYGLSFESKNGMTILHAQTFEDVELGEQDDYFFCLYIKNSPFSIGARTAYEDHFYNSGLYDYECLFDSICFYCGEPADITEN